MVENSGDAFNSVPIPRLLGGKYEVDTELGRGGMGVVFRGRDTMLKRPVAIKVLPPQLTLDTSFVRRFQQEAITAANLRHPNIVTIHDVGNQDGFYYIVMEFIEGTTVEQWIHDHGPMSPQQAGHVLHQITDALDHAHQSGLIHRDIKPANIMLNPSGHATLMDFGLVRAGEAGLTGTGIVVGTPDYMAPEQALGQPIDRRTDIYALGVVVYRMLTGQVPFARSSSMATIYAHVHEPPPPLRQIRSDIPKPIEAVVLKTLAKKPANRYQTAGQLAADFGTALAGKMPAGLTAVTTPPPGAVTKAGNANVKSAASSSTRVISHASSGDPARFSPPPRLSGRILVIAMVAVLFLAVSGVVWAVNRTAAPAATPTAEIVALVTPVPTPEVVNTSTPIPQSEVTRIVVVTATPRPTSPMTATSLISATATASPTPTVSKTRLATPALARMEDTSPVLQEPTNNAYGTAQLLFRWQWDGPALAPNQGFEVRIWRDGQADHFGAAEPVRTTSAVIDLNQAAGVRQGGAGTYLWTVAVVQLNPYKRIGKEATPRTLRIGGVPPTPSRSAAPLIGPGAAQRFAGAVGILSGSLLLGWLYLSGALEAWLRRRRP